jgi:hypothetical protein
VIAITFDCSATFIAVFWLSTPEQKRIGFGVRHLAFELDAWE